MVALSSIYTLPALQFLLFYEFSSDEPGGKIRMPEITGHHVQKPILHVLEDSGGLRCGNKVALVFVGEDNFVPQRLLDLVGLPSQLRRQGVGPNRNGDPDLQEHEPAIAGYGPGVVPKLQGADRS
jgi:hypothetical protein